MRKSEGTSQQTGHIWAAPLWSPLAPRQEVFHCGLCLDRVLVIVPKATVNLKYFLGLTAIQTLGGAAGASLAGTGAHGEPDGDVGSLGLGRGGGVASLECGGMRQSKMKAGGLAINRWDARSGMRDQYRKEGKGRDVRLSLQARACGEPRVNLTS